MNSNSLVALAGAMYIGPDNAIRISSFNSASSVELTIAGQIVTDGGRVADFVFRHVPNTDRTIANSLERLGCGWLLNLQVFASSGAPRRGQCFVRVQLTQGFTGAVISLATIVQGYVQDTTARGWPGALLEASTEGPGVLRSITGSDPAAGAESSETVPTNARWKVHAYTIALTTDATVANRNVELLIDDGATVLYHVGNAATQTAATTRAHRYSRHQVAPAIMTNANSLSGPPDLTLSGGSRIRTSTGNLQAGDNFAAPQLLVEEWIED